MASTVQSKVQVFQHIYASKQDEGTVVGKRDGSQLYLTAHGLVFVSDFRSLLALIDLSDPSISMGFSIHLLNI